MNRILGNLCLMQREADSRFVIELDRKTPAGRYERVTIGPFSSEQQALANCIWLVLGDSNVPFARGLRRWMDRWIRRGLASGSI